VKISCKIAYLSPLNLATLRLGGRNFRFGVFLARGSFAQAAQILSYGNTEFTECDRHVYQSKRPPLLQLSFSAPSVPPR
jgi:hypothetical protein